MLLHILAVCVCVHVVAFRIGIFEKEPYDLTDWHLWPSY